MGSCCASSNSVALGAVGAHPATQLLYVLLERIPKITFHAGCRHTHFWQGVAWMVRPICAHRARYRKLIVWLLDIYILEACAVICRKAIVMLPDANFLSPWCQSPSSRAQNRGFCALSAFGAPVFGHFEHKIGVFVSERATFPRFCPLSSTKSGNWGICAREE